jgi:cytochrome P450
MTRLTFQIVGRSLFGVDLSDDTGRVSRSFTYANQYIAELTSRPFSPLLIRLPSPGNRRLRAAIKELDEVVYKIIDERRRRGQETGDLLSMLMSARDEDTGEAMDDAQVRDEVMTLMLAGHETTANALTWTWYLLSQNPAAEVKLHEELRRVLAGRSPTFEDLPGLKYTRMVIEEALRLYPPAYVISRLTGSADRVGYYHLPAGSSLLLSPYLTHRHPDFWPDPEKFDPERFNPDQPSDRPRYAYLPFGGGPRQCIGNTFAMTEAQLVLATMAQRVRLSLVHGHPVEFEPLITLRPKFGMKMVAAPISTD